MTELIGSFFSSIFGQHSSIATIIISMFPIIELKGAIPVGVNTEFWGEYALSGRDAFLFSLLGSCLVVPIVLLVFKPVLTWLKRTKLFRKIGIFIDQKVRKHSTNIEDKSKVVDKKSWKRVILRMLGVFAFVAVPLPLTGVWTGSCIAVMVGLKFWQSIISVVLGNIVAGLIITTICAIFPKFTTILFFIVVTIVLIIFIYTIIKICLHKDKDQDVEQFQVNIEENKKK